MMPGGIVISEFIDEAALAAIGPERPVLYDPGLADDRARLLGLLGDAAGLIVRNRTRVDGELLAAAPMLRAVGRLGVGLDNIDCAACAARGIVVLPATGANAGAVAEYVIAAALMLVRGAFRARDRMIGGEWPREALIGGEIAGRAMALVGFGTIARRVAVLARGLGMEIAAFDPFLPAGDPAWRGVRRLALPELLGTADVLSLHVSLTDATRGLIGADEIARMKPGAVVINTARGGVLDEAALGAALREGRLGGAALDVFEAEPLGAGAGFEGVPNLILTPHIAGLTREANARVSEMTVANVLEALARAGV